MATRFELVREQDETFCFQLRTADGDVVLRGLASTSKIMSQNEISHLRDALQDPDRRVPHQSADGEHFFVVKDRDGSVLARSSRSSSANELQALEQQVLAAASAPMIDLTKRRRTAG